MKCLKVYEDVWLLTNLLKSAFTQYLQRAHMKYETPYHIIRFEGSRRRAKNYRILHFLCCTYFDENQF